MSNDPAEDLGDATHAEDDLTLERLVDDALADAERSTRGDKLLRAMIEDAPKVAAIDTKLDIARAERDPDELAPKFGGLTRQEAAIKSHQVRREKALAVLYDEKLGKEIARYKVVNAPKRSELLDTAAAVIFDLGHQILSGDLPIKNAGTAAKVIDTFFNILRLESGQSTSNVEHLSVEEKRQMIREMRDAAQERKAQILDLPSTET